jgi:type VI secretion system lysozyme-like protein
VSEVLRQQVTRPSVLDRLLAAEGDGDGDAGYDVQDFTDAVRRDVENLLNARRPTMEELLGEPARTARANGRRDPFQGREEVKSSVLAYGLPELSSFSRSDQDQRRLAELIREAIEHFEPRLDPSELTVEPVKKADPEGKLHFLIKGTLLAGPTRESIQFVTLVEPGSGNVQVTPGS